MSVDACAQDAYIVQLTLPLALQSLHHLCHFVLYASDSLRIAYIVCLNI